MAKLVNLEKSFVGSMFSVEGKVALVTGATGALGKTAAKAYGYAGAKVMLTGRGAKKLEPLVEEFRAEGIDCDYVTGDPSVVADVENIIAATVAKYGRIDIMCVAHGYNKPQNILDQSVEDWEAIMNADCKSLYIVLKYCAEQMVKQLDGATPESGQGGKIVVVTSQRSKRGMAGYTGYCASKGGADIMIASMACDLSAKYGININAICPTVFRSELTEWMFDPSTEVYKNFMRREPIGRLAEPYDFMGYVLFLSSNASNFITGAACDCSGGYLVC